MYEHKLHAPQKWFKILLGNFVWCEVSPEKLSRWSMSRTCPSINIDSAQMVKWLVSFSTWKNPCHPSSYSHTHTCLVFLYIKKKICSWLRENTFERYNVWTVHVWDPGFDCFLKCFFILKCIKILFFYILKNYFWN